MTFAMSIGKNNPFSKNVLIKILKCAAIYLSAALQRCVLSL